MYDTLDTRDQEIVAHRAALLRQHEYPDCGDFIRFTDGITRRVSHVYPPDWGDMAGVQTSDGGGFYLGPGFVSFSGSLYVPVPMTSLTLTEETASGRVWVFHHDFRGAGRG